VRDAQKENSMKDKKYYALLKEFPFIEKTIRENEVGGLRNIRYCDYIRVQPANEILLGEIPQNYSAWDMINKWQKISFVLLDGTIIPDPVRCITASIYKERSTNSNHSYIDNALADNIFSVIQKLNETKEYWEIVFKLQFLVWTEGGYNILASHSQPNFRATIYKFKKSIGGTNCHDLMQLVYNASYGPGSNWNIDICTLHR
jgi:hypothetical protein